MQNGKPLEDEYGEVESGRHDVKPSVATMGSKIFLPLKKIVTV